MREVKICATIQYDDKHIQTGTDDFIREGLDEIADGLMGEVIDLEIK
ncbi:hypothetical protein [Burkholderia ubonensis]|nr:hypothetical protein [Burkholderia ubonensis]